MPRAADPPTSPDLPDELARAAVKRLATQDEHVEIELEGASLPEQHAANVRLESPRLAQVDLSGSRLESLSLLDCELRGCNLSNLQAGGAALRRVVSTTAASPAWRSPTPRYRT